MEVMYDSVKMNQCGKDVLNLIDALSAKYDSLFDRIKNIPNTTHEWVGPAAKKYSNVALIEKKEFDNYILDLKQYANFLIDYATDLDTKKGNLRK